MTLWPVQSVENMRVRFGEVLAPILGNWVQDCILGFWINFCTLCLGSSYPQLRLQLQSIENMSVQVRAKPVAKSGFRHQEKRSFHFPIVGWDRKYNRAVKFDGHFVLSKYVVLSGNRATSLEMRLGYVRVRWLRIDTGLLSVSTVS